jgi:hypothetical protein
MCHHLILEPLDPDAPPHPSGRYDSQMMSSEDQFQSRMAEGVKKAWAVFIFLSCESLASGNCLREICMARYLRPTPAVYGLSFSGRGSVLRRKYAVSQPTLPPCILVVVVSLVHLSERENVLLTLGKISTALYPPTPSGCKSPC